MPALGLGNAVGLNAVISRAHREKNEKRVRRAADASIFIAFCSWILIVICCFLLVRPYFAWQSGGNEVIARYGRQYLSVCMLFSLGQMGQWVFDRFVIASGKSHLFLFTLSAASLTNLILDPIMIFGLFGFPRLETLGAAIATVIGQTVGMTAGIFINRKWNPDIPFGLTLHPDRKEIRNIIRVGLPSSAVQILTSFVGIALNSILLSFSSTAVAAYGICARIQGVVTVGVHGIDNGLIPIAAYNYGARKWARIRFSPFWAWMYSILFFLPFLAVLELSPAFVLQLFDASEQMLGIAVPALRILALSWLLSIISLVISSSLQGLSRGTESMFLTMTRQALLPLIFAFVLSRTKVLSLVWTAFILAECLGIPFAFFLWKRTWKKVFTPEA